MPVARVRITLLGAGALAVLVLGARVAPGQWRASRAQAGLKQVAAHWDELQKGIHVYGIDHCGQAFPPDNSARADGASGEHLTFECDPERTRLLPTAPQPPLTTPVAYLAALPRDPFSSDGRTYGYFCWNWRERLLPVAVLLSPGPDRRQDVDPWHLRRQLDRHIQARRDAAGWSDEDRGVVASLITPHLYDPTNGLVSGGDLIRVLDAGNQAWGWGKVNRAWRRRIAPDLPLNAAPLPETELASVWTGNGAPPEARTMAEKLRRRESIWCPEDVIRTLLEAGAVECDLASNRCQLLPESLGPVRNVFGREYRDFFAAPRPLTGSEKEALQAWRRTAPAWWDSMSRPLRATQPWQRQLLPSADLYTVLPLFGKSQILMAAAELQEGRKREARARMEALQEALRRISDGPVDAYEAYVHRELNRLAAALKSWTEGKEAAGEGKAVR